MLTDWPAAKTPLVCILNCIFLMSHIVMSKYCTNETLPAIGNASLLKVNYTLNSSALYKCNLGFSETQVPAALCSELNSIINDWQFNNWNFDRKFIQHTVCFCLQY